MKKPNQDFSRAKSKTMRITMLMMTVILLLAGFRYLSTADTSFLLKSAIAETKPESSKSDSSQVNLSTLSTQDLSYVMISPQTNEILQSHNADIQRAPASTLKLITGLIASETLKKTDIIQVGSEVNVEGSRLGLRPGDKISVHELFTALYVNSSNDAAAALAVKISGSIPAFAQKMNEYAAALGCQTTNFTTPHGMPDLDQYTTANDLSKIAVQFLKNEELMEYVKLASAHVQWKDAQGMLREADLYNTNRLLTAYPGDRGLKTGTTTEAGQCLVSYVSRPDGDLLLVLLGSKQRYGDTIKLLDNAWAEQRSEAALKGLVKDPRSLILSPGIF
ncbi:D-alanyl-D-alanine carboxypeptidase family protein [Desulfosporosinus youngiae]|uniref:D-alanyl-D-alanine carboxypeptidase n=1 Tax=Desulfosporosinus youngiae DSM 17734 TaxID=768710 RepID=H5Y495_9FIRM|nr:serine hydrolase [Desulfosporosinus youngiae]EHQ89923.1 D-alanyl-D-alanine carboxypeptidase [Desulfosporosinus youngiae DSM 17734]